MIKKISAYSSSLEILKLRLPYLSYVEAQDAQNTKPNQNLHDVT